MILLNQLAYRANRDGSLLAAYRAQCRVGYVEWRPTTRRWRWQLSLIQPEGGFKFGVADSEQAAKDALAAAMMHWCACAELGAS